jgi:DNA (cytosine-5)-methyltransferase 1
MTSVKGCSVVDLFCGVGGLTHGFIREGFTVHAGIDCDKACKFAYEHNNKARFIDKKIENVTASEIRTLYPKNHKKILIGCAPCQPFSQYTKKKKRDDEKWKLLEAFADLIEETQPHIVSMENVPELETFNKGKVYKDFWDRLSKE